MKILQLVTKRQYRGAEVFAANLSEELIALGHSIMFVGLYSSTTDTLEVSNALNVDLVDRKQGLFSFTVLNRLIKVIRENKPDVVQCNGSDTLKYMAVASLTLPKTPIVYRNISMISEWISNRFQRFLYQSLFKRIDHVTSVGEEAIENFVETFDYPTSRTSVIRRGIPIKTVDTAAIYRNLRKELGLEPGAKIAIHIGNFSPEKNHEFLVDLFENLYKTHPHIKLLCIGNGDLFEDIEKKVRQKKLEDQIFLLGFRSDIPELLAGSDCFVLSSKVEGVPGVILEAGAQRIPSVAIDVGGVSEVLKDGETGYLIRNFSIEEFKKTLIKVIENEEERRCLGENAFQVVLQEFNPLKNAQKFEKLYQDLLGELDNRSLKILQLIQKKQYRGAEVFCCQISNHMLDEGHQVEVISLFEGKAILPFKKNVQSLNRSKNQRYVDIGGWSKLSRYIRKNKPHVVQANAADTLKYTVLSKFFFRWKSPIVYRNASTSSFYISNPFVQRFNSFLLKRVDQIISVSHASKADLIKLYPFLEFKTQVIPVGIEKKAIENGFKFAPGKNIVHIGSFTPEKNHRDLLEIFSRVLKRDSLINLYLIGEGPLKKSVFEEVEKRNLSHRVFFEEGLQDPLPIIKGADVLVLPSLIEGLPGVILEAMYCKTPVVAYDVGGVSEILTPETGDLIPKGNKKLFSEAIIKILRNGKDIRVDKAHDIVVSGFQNRAMSEEFIQCYKELLRRKGRRLREETTPPR